MNKQENTQVKNLSFLLWIARVLSSLIALFLLVFVFAPGIADLAGGQTTIQRESVLPILFFALFIAFAVLAWFNEKLGGYLMIFWGVCAIIYYLAISAEIMAMVAGLPFLICGGLFLLYWQQRKNLDKKDPGVNQV